LPWLAPALDVGVGWLALLVAAIACRAAGRTAPGHDARPVTWGEIADVHYDRGGYDEALRIRREVELPVYERLGDTPSAAVRLGLEPETSSALSSRCADVARRLPPAGFFCSCAPRVAVTLTGNIRFHGHRQDCIDDRGRLCTQRSAPHAVSGWAGMEAIRGEEVVSFDGQVPDRQVEHARVPSSQARELTVQPARVGPKQQPHRRRQGGKAVHGGQPSQKHRDRGTEPTPNHRHQMLDVAPKPAGSPQPDRVVDPHNHEDQVWAPARVWIRDAVH
jgi:hypothetical protein